MRAPVFGVIRLGFECTAVPPLVLTLVPQPKYLAIRGGLSNVQSVGF